MLCNFSLQFDNNYQTSMNKIFKKPQQSVPKIITTLYLLGDDNASKQAFYSQLSIERPQEGQQISIIIKQIGPNQYFEIYDFPTDKMLRTALQLYFNILPSPTIILYFLHTNAIDKDLRQWINILKTTHLYSKIVFVSDVRSIRQRNKIIVRIGKQFDNSVIEHICFSGLYDTAFDNVFANIEVVGFVIATAICLRPTLRERLGESWGKLNSRVGKMLRKFKQKNDDKSVV